MSNLIKRAGVWHFNRRVPGHLAELDDRGIVRQSTKVRVADDPRGITAGRIANRMNEDLETYWRALAGGNGGQAWAELQAATRRARVLGLDYAPMQELIARGVQEVLQRVLIAKAGPQDPASIAAVLGGVQAAPASGILVSGLFDEFERERAVEISKKSPNQMHQWRTKFRRSQTVLLDVIGDKDISHLTHLDAQEFKGWWRDRLAEEGLQRDTANKDFEQLNVMLEAISEAKNLNLAPYFAKLRFRGTDAEEGVPFDPAFVQDRLLAGALDDLNDEARRVCFVMSGTGLRPSEITSLDETTIALRANIPHVKIRANGREVKSKNAIREIPLVGPALEAMRLQPKGFPHYHDNNGRLSACVNQYLEQRGLKPTPDHRMYSLRHTFKDRLRAVETPVELMDQLMAHASSKPKYGKGYTLEHAERWLRKVAFKIVPGAKI